MGNATKFHPHTGAPIMPLWTRPDGREMWPILGASPDDPPPADPPADPPPTPTPPADPPPADKQPPWGKPEDFDAEKAWELIQNLRTEKGDPAKVAELEGKLTEFQTAQQAQMDAIAKALGLKPEDAPADPAELVKQVTAEQGKTAAAETRATAAERQLAVFKIAGDPEVGANALALLDSSSFLASVAEVDPTDETKLTEAVAAAVEKNPLFKVTPGSPTPPFPGGPRTPAPTGAGSLGEAIANKMAAQGR